MAHLAANLELKRTVMDENIQKIVEERLVYCLGNSKNEKELSVSIKDELDKNVGGFGWNVVVGKDFGSYIFHRSKYFTEYKINDLDILLWKS